MLPPQAYHWNESEGSKIFKKGAIFCHKEAKLSSKTSLDYVCDSDTCKILFMTVSEYQLTKDKYMIQEKQRCAKIMHDKFAAFHPWSMPKMAAFCENLRIKVF